MAQQTLEFRQARIERIEAVFKGGQRDCFVRVSAPLTRPLLALMGADYIKGDGRERSIDFDYGLQSIRFDLIPAPGMESQRLRVECKSADRFKAIRKKDKRHGRVTRVNFRLHVAADPKALIDYVLNIGGAEGVATLEPLQGELFAVLPPAIPAPRPEKKTKTDSAAPRDAKMAAAGDASDAPEWVTSTKLKRVQ